MKRRTFTLGGLAIALLGTSLAVSTARTGVVGERPPTTTRSETSTTPPPLVVSDGPVVATATFDTGIEGWAEWWNAATLTVASTPRTGAGALSVRAGSGQATAVRQTDALVPGHRHRLSVFARGTGGMSTQILQFDKNWASTDTITLPVVVLNETDWHPYEVEFSVAPTTVHANVAFAADGPSMLLDDFVVKDLGATPRPAYGVPVPREMSPWQLSWSDEFSGTALDRTLWTPDDAPTDFNGELHCYTSRPENLSLADGNLVLTARREAALPCPGETRFPNGRTFSSALVRSSAVLREGRIEIRARLPSGKGIWPALWLLPKDAARYKDGRNGEIDVAEVIGSSPDVVHASVHYDYTRRVDGIGRQTGSLSLPAPADRDFHVYALEWEHDRMRWFLDDRLFFESGAGTRPWYPPPGAAWPAPFDQDFYVILNLAVGGGWPGDPDASTSFPVSMAVDYVRVFQRGAS